MDCLNWNDLFVLLKTWGLIIANYDCVWDKVKFNEMIKCFAHNSQLIVCFYIMSC